MKNGTRLSTDERRQRAADRASIAHNMCHRKRRFNTKDAATAFGAESKEFWGKAYRALIRPWCRGWHITTKGAE